VVVVDLVEDTMLQGPELLPHLIVELDLVVVEQVVQEVWDMVVQEEHMEMMDQQEVLQRVMVEEVVELAVPVDQTVEPLLKTQMM
jgi:hypothetical protein